MRKTFEKAYKNALLTMLGVTRAVSRADFSPPSKWLAVFENVRISSDIMYAKLSTLDEDVEEEFLEKEEILEKKLGKEKFYSEEELEELKEKFDKVSV